MLRQIFLLKFNHMYAEWEHAIMKIIVLRMCHFLHICTDRWKGKSMSYMVECKKGLLRIGSSLQFSSLPLLVEVSCSFL